MKCCRAVHSLLLLTCLFAFASMTMAQDVAHAVSGVVTRVDKDAKTISVKSADGTEHLFKYTEKTGVHGSHEAAVGMKKGAMDTYMAGKEGTSVVVHYTEKGGDKTATWVDDLGKDTVKTAHGTITKVDKQAHTVTIKTDDGAESTYDFGKDAASDSEHGVVKGWDYTSTKAKEGDKVAVDYTEHAGKKVVHFFKAM
jgi:Cu/Ag efflux protein CusF